MKLKMLASAMLLAASFSASAVNYDLGTLNPTVTDYSSGFSAKYLTDTELDDTWTFKLETTSKTSFGASQTFTYDPNEISDFSIELIGVPGLTYVTTHNPNNTVTVSWLTTLGAGSYAVHVTGTTNVTYTQYSASVSATPVPEPETYGLMLGGLALVGAIARRKKNVA